MQFSIGISKYLISVTLIFLPLSMFVSSTLTSTRSKESLLRCGQRTKNSSFYPNFVQVMESLAREIKEKHYATAYITYPPPLVYGLAQCHRDLSSSDCEVCFSASRKRAHSCLPADSALIFLDGCFLRYDNYNFFNESVNSKTDAVNCTAQFLEGDESLSQQFQLKFAEVVMDLTNQAKQNGGFAIVEGKGGISTVYALAQCWKTLSKQGCNQCLDTASDALKQCKDGSEGRAMLAGCFVRYSTERFFSSDNHSKDHHGMNELVQFIECFSRFVQSCNCSLLQLKMFSSVAIVFPFFFPVISFCRVLNFTYS